MRERDEGASKALKMEMQGCNSYVTEASRERERESDSVCGKLEELVNGVAS